MCINFELHLQCICIAPDLFLTMLRLDRYVAIVAILSFTFIFLYSRKFQIIENVSSRSRKDSSPQFQTLLEKTHSQKSKFDSYLIRNEQILSLKDKNNTSSKSEKVIAFPKIIHQSWKTAYIPSVMAEWVKTWTQQNPTWRYFFWTDKGNDLLVKRFYSSNAEAYHRYRYPVSRADAARIMLLHRFGGVYADLDVQALRPMQQFVSKHPCFLASNQPLHLNKPHLVSINALMGCTARHPFMNVALEELKRHSASSDVIIVAGPNNLHAALMRYTNETSNSPPILLAQPDIFMPSLDGLAVPARVKLKCEGAKSMELSALEKQSCYLMKQRNYTNFVPGLESITDHHWFHTYWKYDELSRGSLVHIKDVVPSVEIDPIDV